MRDNMNKRKTMIKHIQYLTLIISLFLCSSASFAKALINPLDGGLSASMSMSIFTNGKSSYTGFTFNPKFHLKTQGSVGRNGKRGNVSAATISGINTTLSGRGVLTLTNTIENETNFTHIEQFDEKNDKYDRNISFGTASPSEFAQVHQYRSVYGTSGSWSNYLSCMNCVTAVVGVFIEGSPTPAYVEMKALRETKGVEIFPTFKGALSGIPNTDCEFEGECEWGLKANFITKPAIGKTLKFKTTGSFIHYEVKEKGLKKIEARPDLNMTGVLTFDEETNLFKGKVTDGRGVSGTAMGRYYGPKHNEVGIVYSLDKPSEKGAEMGTIYGVRFGGI